MLSRIAVARGASRLLATAPNPSLPVPQMRTGGSYGLYPLWSPPSTEAQAAVALQSTHRAGLCVPVGTAPRATADVRAASSDRQHGSRGDSADIPRTVKGTSASPSADARDPRFGDLSGSGAVQDVVALRGRGSYVPVLSRTSVAGNAARSLEILGSAVVDEASEAIPDDGPYARLRGKDDSRANPPGGKGAVSAGDVAPRGTVAGGVSSGVLGLGSGFREWFRSIDPGVAELAGPVAAVGDYWAHAHNFEQLVPGGRATEGHGDVAAMAIAASFVRDLGGHAAAAAGGDAEGDPTGLATLVDSVVSRAREFEGYGWVYVMWSTHPALGRDRLAVSASDPSRWAAPAPGQGASAGPFGGPVGTAFTVSVSEAVPGCLLPGCVPLLSVDMWEHAYVEDYGTGPDAREAYVRALFETIDWDVIADRLSLGRPFRDLRTAPQLEALLEHAAPGGENASGAKL